jgi:type VI secretion system protein VasG
MTAVNLKSLIGKMNETTRRTLEAAAGLCLSRTHYNIEIEHWLMKLMEIGGTDIAAILSHFDCDSTRLNRDLTRVLDKLKTGNSRPPALAPSTCDVARDAWLHASVEFGDNRIRSGHILYAMLADDGLRLSAIDASPEFEGRSDRVHGERGRRPGRAACQGADVDSGPRLLHDRPHGAREGGEDRPDPRPRR